MNTLQVAKQIKALLVARKWADISVNEVVFGAVRITQAVTETGLTELRTPFVLIQIGSSSTDPEEPGLLEQRFNLILVVDNAQDAIGERVLIGANQAGVTSSKGKGLLEVEEELLDVIRKMNRTKGIRIVARSASAVDAAEVAGMGYIASRSYEVLAHIIDKQSVA